MIRTLLLVAAVAVALLLPGAVAENVWVTEEDVQAAADADAAATLYCEGGFKGEIDKQSGRAELENSVGGDNVVKTILEADKDEMSDKAAEAFSPSEMAFKVGAIVFALLMAIVWFFCCWSSCPCCKCCRCCVKERKTHFIVKLIILVAGAAIVFGIIIAASIGTAGYGQVVDGFDNLACSAASLLNSTLSGQTNPAFIGFMPMLNVFYGMEQNLAPNSDMMAEVTGTLDSTQEITHALKLAKGTLELLEDVLKDGMPSEIVDNDHVCELCTAMIPALGTAADLLGDGVASKMTDVREEVASQFDEDASRDLQATLRTAAEPLTEVKNLLRSSLMFFTDTEKFLQVRGHLNGDGPNTMAHLTNSVMVIALFLSMFMVISLVCFVVKERWSPKEEGGVKPYNKWVHRCACCNWCCSWWFAIWAFFVGGLMIAVSVPMGGMCLIMDDMNSALLNDLSSSLGVNISGDSGEMINSIIDDCFVPVVRNDSKSLMDIIFTRDVPDGPKVYLRKTIVDDVKDSILSVFTALDDQLAMGDANLHDNVAVQTLRDMLATPIDAMIMVTSVNSISSDPDYEDLFTQPSLSAQVPMSSIRCDNATISADFPGIGGDSVPGVKAFVDALDADFGNRPLPYIRSDCAYTVDCDDAAGTSEGDACRAANRFVQAKQTLMDLTNFRCDVFLDPADGTSDCDPLNMARSGPGYDLNCLFPDGTLRKKEKSCALPEFVNYIQDYQTRISKIFRRVDQSVGNLGPTITGGMRRTVTRYIIGPIENVANGVTCTFLGDTYEEVVDGLCYQAVVGFRAIGKAYVGCAVMAFFMIILMYGVWRRTVDNVNSLQKTPVEAINNYQP